MEDEGGRRQLALWSGPFASAATRNFTNIQHLISSQTAAALARQQQQLPAELVQLAHRNESSTFGAASISQRSNLSDSLQRQLSAASESAANSTAAQLGGPFSAWDLLLTALLISIILISIVGNCLVCIAIFTDRRLRKLGNAFIVSLAIADLFVSCLVMTFALCNDLMNYWMFGEWFCDIWISFDIMCCTASILNLCAISLDRFIHIKDCLLYNQLMTRRVAISAVIVIWIISALVSFVPINLGWHKPEHFRSPASLSSNALDSFRVHQLDRLQLHSPLQAAERQLQVRQRRRRRRRRRQAAEPNQVHQLGGGNFDKISENEGPPGVESARRGAAQVARKLKDSPHKSRRDNEAPAGPSSDRAGGSLSPRAPALERQKIDRVGAPAQTLAASSGRLDSSADARRGPTGRHRVMAAQVAAGGRNNDGRPAGQQHRASKHDGRACALYKNELFDQVESNPEALRASAAAGQQQGAARRSQQQIKHLPSLDAPAAGAESQIGLSAGRAHSQARRTRSGGDDGGGEQTNRDLQAAGPARDQGATLLDHRSQSADHKEAWLSLAEDDGGPLAPPIGGRPAASAGPPLEDDGGRHSTPAATELPQCMLTLTPTYAVISSTISFYIPCIIMLGLYSKLFACARRHVRNIKAISKAPHPIGGVSANSGVRSPPQTGGTSGERSSEPTDATDDHNRRHPESKGAGQFGGKLGRWVSRGRPSLGLGDKSRTWIKFGRPAAAGGQNNLQLADGKNLGPPAEVSAESQRPAAGAAQDVVGGETAQAQGSFTSPVLTKLKANLRQNAQRANSHSNGNSNGAKDADKTEAAESEPFLGAGRDGPAPGAESEPKAARKSLEGRPEKQADCDIARAPPDDVANCGRATGPPATFKSNLRQNQGVAAPAAPEANKDGDLASPRRQSQHIIATTYADHQDHRRLPNAPKVNNNHYHQPTYRHQRTASCQQPQQPLPTKQQTSQLATHKAAITLGIIMGTFLFCWVPFFCLNIIKAFHGDSIPSSLFRAFTWLGYANSALNPIIYGIHNSEFRNAFNRIFFKHLTLKNGRQYLNRRFSYDLRPHHQHQHQHQHNYQAHYQQQGANANLDQNRRLCDSGHERQALGAIAAAGVGASQHQQRAGLNPAGRANVPNDATSRASCAPLDGDLSRETVRQNSGQPGGRQRSLQNQLTISTVRSLTTVHRTSDGGSSQSASQTAMQADTTTSAANAEPDHQQDPRA